MTDLERAQLKLQAFNACTISPIINSRPDFDRTFSNARQLWAWMTGEKEPISPPAGAPSGAPVPPPPPMYDEHAAGPSVGGVGFPGV